MTIGNRISTIRKAKGMTQQKLAEVASVDYNTLRKIETCQTKNPSPEIIEKIALALNVSISQLLDKVKPNTQGGHILPFLELSPEEFENLIEWILHRHHDYTDVERYGSRGDKKRDVIAKKMQNGIKSDKSTLFQAKRYQKTDSSALIEELKGIKMHFFDEANPPTPLDGIVFCLADSPSAAIKDVVKLYAADNHLPEPIFWEARTLDIFCRRDPSIINEYFGGHIQEVRERVGQMGEDVQKSLKLQKENNALLQKLDSNVVTVTASDDAEMLKARRLISEKRYTEAQEMLLVLKSKIENSRDNIKLKKLYNNLGLCFSKSQDGENIKKGIEYLKSALDLDPSFHAPKQNLIVTILNNVLTDQFEYALNLAKELATDEPDNLEYAGLYLNTLNACGKQDEIKKLIKDVGDKTSENETLCVATTMSYLKASDFSKAEECIDKGLENFPDSVFLNRSKGMVLMMEAERVTKSREFDIVPFYQKLNLVEDAVEHFRKALDLANATYWPRLVKSQLALALYSALIALRRCKSQNAIDLKSLQKIEKEIVTEDLTKDERKSKQIIDASLKLEQERNFFEAYELFKKYFDEYNPAYADIKNIAKKFFQHGAPEYTVKILLPLAEEAKELEDFEYWVLLSMCYVLMADKNSALRVMNDAKNHFLTNKEIYRKLLSHYGALAARYHDNSESERLVKSMFELQELSPAETVMKPVKAIEDDGTLSSEIKDFFANVKQGFIVKRDLFKSTPLPIYFLKEMFHRSFPEALVIPRDNYDFEFVLPYNALDDNFLDKQKKNFEENDTFVLDYAALLNFARCGQLGLFDALGKKVIVSEYLLFEVQADLLNCEDETLRDAWNFLRSGDVKIFPYRNTEVGGVPKEMQEHFDEWLVQEMDYCIKEGAVLLTDDLRLWHYIYSKEIGAKAINSFIFFQTALAHAALDKRQFSLVLGELADVFYHFIPFNGEDFLNIVLDDDNRIRNNSIAWLSFKTPTGEFKIARRTYHLLKQVELPGSEVESFLVVCLDFLTRIMRLSVLEEEKIDWVLFLTNFFGDFVSEDNLRTKALLTENHVKFVAQAWLLLTKNLPENFHDKILNKVEEIKNESLKNAIRNVLNQFKKL